MKSSKLLMDERPLQVLPLLAKKIGINHAIILQQLHWLLQGEKNGIIKDGLKWIYNTYDEWQEHFTWLSISTIKTIFLALEKSNLVITKQLRSKNYDRRKYYTINYEAVERLEINNRIDKICPIKQTKNVHSEQTKNVHSIYTKTTQENPTKKTENNFFEELGEKLEEAGCSKIIWTDRLKLRTQALVKHINVGGELIVKAAQNYYQDKFNRENGRFALDYLLKANENDIEKSVNHIVKWVDTNIPTNSKWVKRGKYEYDTTIVDPDEPLPITTKELYIHTGAIRLIEDQVESVAPT